MNATYPFLFVYGTLMWGFGRDLQHSVRARFLGPGTIRARLYDLGSYPGAKLADKSSENFVKGELYRLRDPEAAIMTLDKYEGYSPLERSKSLFIRELVTVRLACPDTSDGSAACSWSQDGTSISEPRVLRSDIRHGTLEGARKRKAWTYLYNRPVDEAKLIPSGNYRDRACAC